MGQSAQSSTKKNWLSSLRNKFDTQPNDRTQLVDVLRQAHNKNLFDASAMAMIEGVLQVSELQVRDIMIPRSQMVVVEEEDSLQDMLPIIVGSAHSRFPVVGDSRDEVSGVLLAKDLLRYMSNKNTDEFNIKDLLRPAFIVPESKRLNILLNEFRNSRNHMAIIVDEYGGVSGLVTIEDVLEEIVGEIEDETDEEEAEQISKINDNLYRIEAITEIDDFNEYFDIGFSDDEFDTVGGLVVHKFGRLPDIGESVSIENFDFKVIDGDNRKINLLEVRKNNL